MSLSSWRAWIEIPVVGLVTRGVGRSPHGERGLKFGVSPHGHARLSRSPHGERGLK